MTQNSQPAKVVNSSNAEFWMKVADLQSLNASAAKSSQSSPIPNISDIIDAANHTAALVLMFARNVALGMSPSDPTMENDMRMAQICFTALDDLAYPSFRTDEDAHVSMSLAEVVGPSKEEPATYIKLVTDRGPSKCSSGVRRCHTARPAYLRVVADDQTS
ncbi:hypothetical protein B0E45_17815 [Sinorhizobium sp. A49]|uniref:hypothetical protein n=1 Tax=Sinorhizobium sp. A49 TaxID=1945861 RepID=UPI000986F95E|nr:hypothetical protein [Sinorhizobium sp. A49]OOG68185.1 hypothetical protein B0E45_17815 [Sinorhizobium sp. A49]